LGERAYCVRGKLCNALSRKIIDGMSTQTLTKPRAGGAREAQTASVELPEAVNPAKKRLSEMLTAYDKAGISKERTREGGIRGGSR
jgi:hypothetical protein